MIDTLAGKSPTWVMTRLRAVLLALTLALVATFVTFVGTASAASCPTGWGSLPKDAAPMGTAALTGVRAGQHPCYDRLVFDIAGPVAGYHVAYVDTVYAEGSGAPLYVPGRARLAIVVHHPAGALPYGVNQRVLDVSHYSVLQSATYGGSYEGYTEFGAGVSGRLPFRVFALNDGRLVIDFARSW